LFVLHLEDLASLLDREASTRGQSVVTIINFRDRIGLSALPSLSRTDPRPTVYSGSDRRNVSGEAGVHRVKVGGS
jgi:hypothetical protein